METDTDITATEEQLYLRITGNILNAKMANMKGLSRLEVTNELQDYCDIILPVSDILNSCLFLASVQLVR